MKSCIRKSFGILNWLVLSATALVLLPSFCAALVIPWMRHSGFWTLGTLIVAGLFVGGLAGAIIVIRRLPLPHLSGRTALLLLAVALVFRVLLILGHSGYRQAADCLYYFDFVRQMADGGINQANLAVLSRIWDYQLWLGRAFPLSISLAWLLGEGHLLGAQMLNVVLSSATSGLLYLIGRKIMGARPAIMALAIWSFSPITHALNLDYTHQIQGSFWVVLGLWLLFLFPVHSDASRTKSVISLLLSGVFCLLMLQRGLDLLLWSIVLVHIVWVFIRCSPGRKRLASAAFYLVLVPGLLWGTARVGFQHWSDQYNEARLGSGLASIIVHGWNSSTGGEYYSFYEQVDRLTPEESKQSAAFRIMVSKVAYEPIHTLGRLMLVKIAKFHLVGYASGIEQGFESSGYSKSAMVFKTTRLVYAPILLAGALAGLFVLLRRSCLNLRWATLATIPLLGCLQFAMLGQTSPRYSFYTQFVLALLAGLAFSRRTKTDGYRPPVQSIFRWICGGGVVIALYGFACLCAYGVVRGLGEGARYVDLRKARLSGQALASDASTGALECDVHFPMGWVGDGDRVECCFELPEAEAHAVAFLLWQTVGISGEKGTYRCEVLLNGHALDSFELAPEAYFQRKEYALEAGHVSVRTLCIRLSYAGPPSRSVVDVNHPLKLGFVGLW